MIRRFVTSIVVSMVLAGTAAAQDFPNRPITLVVPNAPGGGTDVYARILAKGLEKRLGQPVVIENKPGQGSSLGGALVARAEPNGYTLLLATSSTLAINVTLYKKLSYDPMKDFTFISLVGAVPFVLVVNPSVPANSLAELIALAKQKPGELSFGSAGLGSGHQIFFEKVKSSAGIDIKHVPYRGGAPALADVVGGHIPMMFADASQVRQYIADGRVKALAVTSAQRLPQLPNVPTLDEAGVKGFDGTGWISIVGPAGIPAPIVATLHKALVEVVKSPDAVAFQEANGMDGPTTTPDELRKFVGTEIVKWRDVLVSAGTEPIE